ncbi:MAG: Gldg family protein [Clostridia bacterium]|nr:Gldg family protein [Clostridia bacterium]
MKRLSQKNARKERDSRVAIVALVVAFLALNLILTYLVSTYGWYFLATDPQFYTLSGVTDEYFARVNPEGRPVKLYFCKSEAELKEDNTLHRIFDTVRQFDERYEFFSVEHLNTYYDFAVLDRFAKEHETELTSHAVIVYAPDTGKSELLALADFYYFDENGTSDDMVFAGEELLAGAVGAALCEERPSAIFTTGHGELSTLSMVNTLYAAGFEIKTEDLSATEIPEECSLIVISSPRYDFEEYNDATITSEISRLRAFIARGGTVLYLRDATAGSLPRLDAFFASMGILPTEGVVMDPTYSVDLSGSAVLLRYDEGEGAAPIRERAEKYNDARLAGAAVGALTLSSGEGYRAEALLRSHESAYRSVKGESIYDAEGGYAVAALSEVEGKRGAVGYALCISAGAFVEQTQMETAGYGNKPFLLSALMETTGAVAPIGSGVVLLNTYPLEDMTRGVANTYLILLAGVVPLAIALLGYAVVRRRTHH